MDSPLSEPRRLRLRLDDELHELDAPRVVIGRSRSCDVRLRDDSISRLHAAFIWHGETLVLEDLGSANGTFHNGERVYSPRVVTPGDRVRFGSLRGVLELPGEAPASGDRAAAVPAPQDQTVGIVLAAPAGTGWRLLAAGLDLALFVAGSIAPLAPLVLVLLAQRGTLTPWVAPPGAETRALVAGGSGVLWIIFTWYYLIHGWAKRGGTPALRFLGLRLLDWRYRIPIGYTRAWLRLAAVAVTGLSLGLGFLTSLFRRDRKTLHDLLAGTMVVHRPRNLGHVGVD